MNLIACQSLKVGDEITFFYPSTEWRMAQPFTCQCNTDKCIGLIYGASELPRVLMDKFIVAKHIVDLLNERDAYAVPFDKDPIYPDILEILRNGVDFTSRVVVKKEYQKGDVICNVIGATLSKKRWTSIQVGPDTHRDFNSELVYMNHSCDPSVHISTAKMQIIAAKDLHIGDELTFFYPSTEWFMSKPFDCWCGTSKCLKTIQGAKFISPEATKHFYFAEHILEMKNEQRT